MPISSPSGPLVTLDDVILEARRDFAAFESRATTPVLLLAAPAEKWADSNVIRATTFEFQLNASVSMLPTLVLKVKSQQNPPADVVFGRMADCDVIMPFTAVSKQHGIFRELPDGQWSVQDLGSKNGTFVDGQKVEKEPVIVRDGAQMRFGDISARLLLSKTFVDDIRKRV